MSQLARRVEALLGPVNWWNESVGSCACPGAHLHTTPTKDEHCKVVIKAIENDGKLLPPGVYCFHSSCREVRETTSNEVRRLVGAKNPNKRMQFKKQNSLSATEAIGKYTGNSNFAAETLLERSPVSIPDSPIEQTLVTLSTMYELDDMVNIVVNSETGAPVDSGLCKPARFWIDDWNRRRPIWQKGGAWIRLNPATGDTDAAVTKFKYSLLECDGLPVDLQLRLYAHLPIPISLIALSGGKSAHAWVRMDAADLQEYREIAKRLFEILKHFGIDQSNKNASRLGRLPGAIRQLKATGDGVQRLLYLDPNAESDPIL